MNTKSASKNSHAWSEKGVKGSEPTTSARDAFGIRSGSSSCSNSSSAPNISSAVMATYWWYACG
ncbi:MAG: hypothetical protein IJ892_08420 [Prevotella sp.]|nr:hypothetical protein [Prevotella sp.]